jgi:hypothetical protein
MNSIALPSMDSWIEAAIKKKQNKKGLSQNPLGSETEDPFEEINSYLRQPRLWREACPNPILYWGVCNFLVSSSIVFNI